MRSEVSLYINEIKMERKKIKLVDGSIEFWNQKLVITDQVKRRHDNIVISTCLGFGMSIPFLIIGILKTDYFQITIWTILFSINVFAIFSKQLETIHNQLLYSEIRKVEFKSLNGYAVFGYNYIRVTFHTKNHKKRIVKLIDQKEIIEEFIELMSVNKIQVIPSYINMQLKLFHK